MNRVLPETPGDIARQVDHYEWIKKHYTTDWYHRIVQVAEQRTGNAR